MLTRKDGLQRMLDFLNRLDDLNIWYEISKPSPDGLKVRVTLVTVRLEVSFTPDEMTFSVFRGTEEVETDEAALNQLIEKYGT